MQYLREALAIGCVVAALGVSSAHADPYRWCAVYSGDAGGASNCGFVTLEQCRATVSGIGGFCEPNQFYTGPEPTDRRAVKRVRPAYGR
jgi:hypothetical protein